MLTNQSIFDQVWNHFITLKNPPSNSADDSSCAYRGANGAKCAIGVLIPDELYKSEMDEGTTIAFVIKEHDSIRQLFAGIDTAFLSELQSVHDIYADYKLPTFTTKMEEGLRKFAIQNQLTIP